jgi:hypothetical protein
VDDGYEGRRPADRFQERDDLPGDGPVLQVVEHVVVAAADHRKPHVRQRLDRPGDYICVPPYVPHREENPDPDTEAVVVIARTTQEAIVVNLDALDWSQVSFG